MAGLLYKDFVAVHGKLYTVAMLALTLLIAFVSITPVSEDMIIVVGAGTLMLSMCLPMLVSTSVESSIVTADAGAKKKAYLFSLPVSKKQYVASKYLFVLICYYVIASLTVIWAQFVNLRTEEALQNSLIADAMGLLPLWIQVCLLVSAMELPFYIVAGVKAGNAIKTSILFVLMFVVFGYMLFGDLSYLEHFNIGVLVTWLEEHMEVTMALQVLGPVWAGGIYYLSYRLAAFLFVRKEQEDEE